jgi:predicted secreted protein
MKYLPFVGGFRVKDFSVARELIESFFRVAQSECLKIKSSCEQSNINEIQLTEKALNEYNERQKQINSISGKDSDAIGTIASSLNLV